MAYNISRDRQREMLHNQRVAALKPFLEPGWQLDRRRPAIVAVPTVLGHYQRGQQLLLQCKRADCRRRCEVDLRSAIQAGLGEHSIPELIALHRCQHWRGCEVQEAMAIYPQGVPLVAYVSDPDKMISIACVDCGHRWLVTPADAIRRLKAAGTGNGNTGILKLAKVLRGRCRQCGLARFQTTTISLRPAPGSGRSGPGW